VRSLHVTVASSLFILSSLIGLWYSAAILPRYIATYRATLRVRDPGERRLAEGLHFEIMVGEIVRCVLHTLFLVAGIWSLTIAPAPIHPQSINQQWFGVYFLWMLVTANIGLTINTLTVRHGYRKRRGEVYAKRLPSRDQFAALRMDVRNLRRRVGIEERRNTSIEERATAAHARADVSEARADLSDETLDDHEGRLEVVEEVTEIKHTITKQQDGAP
jgi:hypothetical protein